MTKLVFNTRTEAINHINSREHYLAAVKLPEGWRIVDHKGIEQYSHFKSCNLEFNKVAELYDYISCLRETIERSPNYDELNLCELAGVNPMDFIPVHVVADEFGGVSKQIYFVAGDAIEIGFVAHLENGKLLDTEPYDFTTMEL